MYVRMQKRRGLRGYRAGSFPIPIFGFRGLGCAGGPKRLGAVEDSPYYTGDGVDTFIGPMPPTDYATPAEIYAASNVGSQAVPGQTRGVPSGIYSSGVLTAANLPMPVLPVPQYVPPTATSTIAGISTTTLLLGGGALFLVLVLSSKRR